MICQISSQEKGSLQLEYRVSFCASVHCGNYKLSAADSLVLCHLDRTLRAALWRAGGGGLASFRSSAMPPKRKDASRKVFAPIKASPAPVTQAKPAADPAEVARLAQIRTARKRLIRNLFRLFMAGTVLLWMWPKIFPGEEVDLTAVTEQEEPVFEEILVDVEKRSAVLAAFKAGH